MSKPQTIVRNVSDTQLAILMYITIMATATLFVPALTAQRAHQAAWIATGVLPAGTGIVTVFLVTKLAALYPGQTLVQYCQAIFGKWLGKLFALSYVAFFLFGNILVIREFAEFMAIMMLPGTPILFLCALIVLTGVYIAPKGPEVLCRMAQFLLPLFAGSFLLLIALTTPDLKLDRLIPVFEGGLQPIVQGSIVPSSWFGEIVLVAMFLPNVNKPREMRGKGMATILAVGLVLTVDTLTVLALFGPNLTATLMFPFWSLAKYIKLGMTVQRLELFVVSFWVAAMILKVAVFYYAAYEGLAQSLGVANREWVLYPLAVGQIMAANYLFSNTLNLSHLLGGIWPKVALLFEVPLPLFFWLVASYRKRPKRKQA